MMVRSLSSDTALKELDELLRQVRDSGDQVVLTVDGMNAAVLGPLTEQVQQELLRESFGRFWDAHVAHQRENPPPDRSEEEIMEEALEIQREIRAEIRARKEVEPPRAEAATKRSA